MKEWRGGVTPVRMQNQTYEGRGETERQELDMSVREVTDRNISIETDGY